MTWECPYCGNPMTQPPPIGRPVDCPHCGALIPAARHPPKTPGRGHTEEYFRRRNQEQDIGVLFGLAVIALVIWFATR